jgi:hypothetical protein
MIETQIAPPLKADRDMAEQFGIQANVIRRMRDEHLIENVHWRKTTGRGAMQFTEEGVKALQMAMGMNLQKKDADVAPLQDVTMLRVVRPCKNPLFITVALPDNISKDLRVSRNKNVRKGMLVQCAIVNGEWRVTQKGLTPR